MSNIVTYTARAKLKHLLYRKNIEDNRLNTAVKITYNKIGMTEVQYLDRKHYYGFNDIILSLNPCIITDAFTLNKLSDNCIDFNYGSNELTIKLT